jgi:isocitrate dehydrogenase
MLDATPEVIRFAQALERVCINTVESGKVTKDLALMIGPDTPYLTTEAFLDELDRGLQHAAGL